MSKFLISFIFVLFLFQIPAHADYNDCIKGKLKQISLSKDMTGSGSMIFLVGGMNFNEEAFYYFYYQTFSGGYKLVKIPTYNITVFEDAKTPYYKYCRTVSLWDSTTARDWYRMRGGLDWTFENIELHVPKGSLLNTVDLKIK